MRRIFALAALLACLATMARAQMMPIGAFVQGSIAYAGPCDVFASNGTSCVAAYSMTRKMLAAWGGAAFQVTRASDSTTQDIGFLASGAVNRSTEATFCAATTCTVTLLYDQTGNGNNLPTGAAAIPASPTIAAAPYAEITTAGSTFPVLKTASGQAYRRRTSTTAIPTGGSAVTVYEVANNSVSAALGGAFSENESTVHDDGAGTMFGISYSTLQVPTGSPAQYGLEHENGDILIDSYQPPNFTLIVKKAAGTATTTAVELEMGDATTGGLRTLYAGPGELAAAWNLEGGLSAGEGGDASATPFAGFEFAVLAGETSDAADAAAQANIAAFYGVNRPAYQGPLDIASGATAFYSPQCGSAALATGTTKTIQYENLVTAGTQDGDCLANGAFDAVTAQTFGPVDAVFLGYSVSGTMTVTSVVSGTIHVNDQLFGGGATYLGSGNQAMPFSFVTALGTGTGGTGTYTIINNNHLGAQDIARSATPGLLIARQSLGIAKAYDQSGSANNATQATEANQPFLLFNSLCVAEPACIMFPGTSTAQTTPYLNWGTSLSALSSLSLINWFVPLHYGAAPAYELFDEFATTSTNDLYFTPHNDSTTSAKFALNNGTGEQAVTGGSEPTTGTTYHYAATLDHASTTAKLYIDGANVGTSTTVTLRPLDLGSTTDNFIAHDAVFSVGQLIGQMTSIGIWPTALSAGTISSLNALGP